MQSYDERDVIISEHKAEIKIAKIKKDEVVKVAWADKAIPVAVIYGLTLIICTIIFCWKLG